MARRLRRRFVDDEYLTCSGVRRVRRNVSRVSRLMRICDARVFIAAESHGRQNLRNPRNNRGSRCRCRLSLPTPIAVREIGPVGRSRFKPQPRKYLRELSSDPSPHRVPSEGASSAPRCLTELKSELEVSRASSPHPPHVRNRSHARNNRVRNPNRDPNHNRDPNRNRVQNRNHVQNRVLKDRLSVTSGLSRLSRDHSLERSPDPNHARNPDQRPDRSPDPNPNPSHRAVNHPEVSRLVNHEGLNRDRILVQGDRIIFEGKVKKVRS